MAYRIEFAPSAEREFSKLPRQVQIRLMPHIDAPAKEPRPHGVERLTGEQGLYRIRVGAYRIVYTIKDDELVVLVVKVGHRREVYRRKPE